MRALLRPTLFACLLGVAFVVTQKLVYEPFVVPRLAQWQEIPWQWWLAISLPELAICLASALVARNLYEIAGFAVVGAILVACLQWLANVLNQPGHFKTIEGGPVHFAIHALVLTVLLFTVVGSFYALRLGWHRVRAS
jgi:hypothetical protein